MSQPLAYFYLYRGKEYGPIPARRLKLLLQNGLTDPDSRYRLFGSRKWVDEDAAWAFVISAEKGEEPPADYVDSFDEERRPLFDPVSKRKYLIMSITTLGVYFILWVYRTWQSLNRLDHRMRPLIPTITLYISGGSLAWQVDDVTADTLGREPKSGFLLSWKFGYWMQVPKLAILAIIPFCQIFILAPLIFPIAFLPTVNTINDANELRTPECIPDDQFSTTERVWIAVSLTVGTVGVIALYYLYYSFIFVRLLQR